MVIVEPHVCSSQINGPASEGEREGPRQFQEMVQGYIISKKTTQSSCPM